MPSTPVVELSLREDVMSIGIPPLAQAMLRGRRGSVAIQIGLMMVVVLGMVALGTEITFLMFKHRQMQSAADSAALGGATALAKGYPVDFRIEAYAVAAEAGFVNGADGVTIAVNRPPSSGSHSSNQSAVEVIIAEPQTLNLVSLFRSGLFNVSARAIAVTTATGSYCVLALNGNATGAVTTQGIATVNLTGCSLAVDSNSVSSIRVSGGGTINADKVTTVGGVELSGGGTINAPDGIVSNSTTNFNDPYGTIAVPAVPGICAPNQTSYSSGCTFANNLSLTSGKTLTLSSGSAVGSGVYVIDGNLTVNGGASLIGNNVTIVVTGQIVINGGADITITAPTNGITKGIAFFGKGSGTSTFEGGATQNIIGAVYLPNQAVKYAGGNELSATKCVELIANTITFTGNSNFSLDCSGMPIGNIGGNLVKLVE